MIFLHVSIPKMFSKLFKNPAYSFNIVHPSILGTNQNVIQMEDHKDVKLFSQNLVNVVLKTRWHVSQAKEQNLVLKVNISSLESCLPLISFTYSY